MSLKNIHIAFVVAAISAEATPLPRASAAVASEYRRATTLPLRKNTTAAPARNEPAPSTTNTSAESLARCRRYCARLSWSLSKVCCSKATRASRSEGVAWRTSMRGGGVGCTFRSAVMGRFAV